MNSRSGKYFESRKAQNDDKNGSADYDEQKKKAVKKQKKAPVFSKTQNHLNEDAPASQDDTGGGNNSGKRSDKN